MYDSIARYSGIVDTTSLKAIIAAGVNDNEPLLNTFSVFPNPAKEITTISFNISNKTQVSIKVYNLLGEEIAEILNKNLLEGNYSFNWETEKAGIYLVKIQTDKESTCKKIIITN
jgi:hypothetical protein